MTPYLNIKTWNHPLSLHLVLTCCNYSNCTHVKNTGPLCIKFRIAIVHHCGTSLVDPFQKTKNSIKSK
jgi:hypothetical protein